MNKFLHGVDLDVWRYLGFCILRMDEEDECYVFFFARKGQEEYGDRHYICIGDGYDRIKYTQYMILDIPLWKIGEGDFKWIVDNPSDWLLGYMEELGMEFDYDELMWVQINPELQKYNQELKKQKRKPLVLVSSNRSVDNESNNGQDIPEK